MYISLENVTKKYGKDQAAVYALNRANLQVPEGAVCVILGPSGSGKSTMLNILGGLSTPDSGTLTVGGQQVSRLSAKGLTEYRRKAVGFVFQFYNLIGDLTVAENIEVASDVATNPLPLEDLLQALEIGEYRHRFPKELSGGQQQRVAIARAMIKNPRLLLCDELTGALDTKSSRAVLSCVERINREFGTTVIIITHNEAIAGMADLIVRLRDGQVVSCRENSEKISADQLIL